MSEINSYQFLDVYKEINIDIKNLYCTMLNIKWKKEVAQKLNEIFTEHTKPYFSENKPWIKGFVGLNKAHLTLLYGTLPGVTEEHIKKVLEGINLTEIEIKLTGITYFDSPDNENYYCVVAKVELTDSLLDIHQRLSLLPHINTFPNYSPHITLGYIEKDFEAFKILGETNLPLQVTPTRIIYDNMSGKPKIIK